MLILFLRPDKDCKNLLKALVSLWPKKIEIFVEKDFSEFDLQNWDFLSYQRKSLTGTTPVKFSQYEVYQKLFKLFRTSLNACR